MSQTTTESAVIHEVGEIDYTSPEAQLARAILMPEEIFRAAAAEGLSVAQLSQVFEVEPERVAERAGDLGIAGLTDVA